MFAEDTSVFVRFVEMFKDPLAKVILTGMRSDANNAIHSVRVFSSFEHEVYSVRRNVSGLKATTEPI